jgi:hypothetical protein
MTARAAAVVEVIRSALASLDSLDPVEANAIVSLLVSDLRARRPMSVAPLSALPAPTESITDPRTRTAP